MTNNKLEVKTEYLSFITINRQTLVRLADKIAETFIELNASHPGKFQFPYFRIDSEESSLSTFDINVFKTKLEESFDGLNAVEINIKRLQQEIASFEEVYIRITKQFNYVAKDYSNSISIQGSDSTWVRGKMDLFRSILQRRANKNKFFYGAFFRGLGQLSAVILMLFGSIKIGNFVTTYMTSHDQSWLAVLTVLLLLSNIWTFLQAPLYSRITQWKPVIGFGEIADNSWKFNTLIGIVGSLLATAIWSFISFFVTQ